MATTEKLFVWNRNYGDHEQVRPFMDQFLQVHAGIVGGGAYPYNDSFKGRIDGIAGSESEDTAIYLLQNLKSLDELDVQVAEFVNNGGCRLTDSGLVEGRMYRGTVVNYGFYVGGTGWRQHDNVRFQVHYRQDRREGTVPTLQVWGPRKRNPVSILGGQFLVRTG
ncbi:hypothetical protein ACFQNE_14230 [Gordonia phosphorivorans]|uniref:Uncharacterized protein n=1 Tax=Gordonia phosphorivorans TaxID=1056982 RepID=A0ABV6H9N1_9ACTN